MKHIKNFLHRVVENIMEYQQVRAQRIVKQYSWFL